ncbi:hypothetical protein V5O48_006359 [Marasmius crinis-equi]|uniref:DUF6535 domain-containing protein n=1 Tax=Marasmius crinis-equi TaxID=585013 RepID=A0ABR3FJX0_9AGAR
MPSLEESWGVIMKKVDGIDEGVEKGWKEDIDTLLVFAGLFSAVVAAFTVESYQWLSEDPSDTTVAVLNQISRQLNGQNLTVSEDPSFTPSPSVVRINTFWFLSLILSLVDALLGLMFKQWLQEYRRPTITRTPDQWLALRCFRSESFERWHVPSFLAALPMILEAALFCFFAGLLELLWMQHRIPFAFAAATIGSAVGFYITTALLPGIDIIRLAFRVHPDLNEFSFVTINRTMFNLPQLHYVCPYKSPQAWAMFRLLASFINPSFALPRGIISHFLRKRYYSQSGDDVSSVSLKSLASKIRTPGNWSSVDLDIIQRFSNIQLCPDMYVLKAHRWMAHEFQDSPLMTSHLERVLQVLPPHLVLPAVLDHEIVRLDRDWNASDVGRALKRELRRTGDTFTFSEMNIRSLFYHDLWIRRPLLLHQTSPPLKWEPYPPSPKYCQAPLPRILQLIEGGNYTLGNSYLEHIMRNEGGLYPRPTDLVSIASSLQSSLPHLATANLNPADLQPLLNFLQWLSKRLIERSIFGYMNYSQAYGLIDALDAIRVSQGLRSNYFARDPRYFPVSMTRLNAFFCDPSTKDRALEFIKEYRCAWGKTEAGVANRVSLLRYLWTYILASIPRDLRPQHHQNRLPDIIATKHEDPSTNTTIGVPHLLFSQEGLSLLEFFSARAAVAVPDDAALERWQWALECVAHVNGLPSNYFSSLSPANPEHNSFGPSSSGGRPNEDKDSETHTGESDHRSSLRHDLTPSDSLTRGTPPPQVVQGQGRGTIGRPLSVDK